MRRRRPKRRRGAYRNHARPTRSDSGTGPKRVESIGGPKPASAAVGGSASAVSHASSGARWMKPPSNGTVSPGRAATRLTASTSLIGSRNTTTVPFRGQRRTVGSTSSQSPGSIAGSIEPSATAIRHGPRRNRATKRRSPAGRRGSRLPAGSTGSGRLRLPGRLVWAGDGVRLRRLGRADGLELLHPGGGRTTGRAPHLVDLVDQIEKLLGLADVRGSLPLRGLLRRLPARVVEVRELLDVLGLEVVVPHHVDVVLGKLGALLLDVDAARAEELVRRVVVLLDDLVAGLGLDPGLLGVVDAARNVAMGMGDGGRGEPASETRHGSPFGTDGGGPTERSGLGGRLTELSQVSRGLRSLSNGPPSTRRSTARTTRTTDLRHRSAGIIRA